MFGSPDGLTFDGALRQQKIIEAYWMKRGRKVECRIETVGSDYKGVLFGLRSNMLAGMPQKVR